MTVLAALPDSFASTRDALQRVAVHILARARVQATGRFGLRPTVGGFGTPEFGDRVTRVRVAGALLVCETGGTDGATSVAAAIDGASLADLATVAGVDLAEPLDVGHDTPPLGDADETLAVDAAAAASLADWYAVVAGALDRAVAELGADASPTTTQLWPEHFDVALDVAATADRRINLGGSPGDGFHAAPYAYVGPWTSDWTSDRPGDQAFWNAPFGAVLGYEHLVGDGDAVARITEFFLEGVRRLTG
jgi:hypothetical protein